MDGWYGRYAKNRVVPEYKPPSREQLEGEKKGREGNCMQILIRASHHDDDILDKEKGRTAKLGEHHLLTLFPVVLL